MPTPSQYLDAAERLKNQGRLDDARFMVLQAQQALATEAAGPGPMLVIPELPAEPAPPAAPAVLQQQQAAEQAEKQAREAAMKRLPATSSALVEEVVTEEQELATEAIEAERGKAVVVGLDKPVSYQEQGAPFFRPTRIVETEEGRRYRDPEDDDLREPTLSEEFVESFAQQTILGEEAAREETPMGVLARKESGVGLVEAPLSAAFRSGLGYLSATAGETYFRGLGYEVDAEGRPVDPEDWGLAIAEWRKKMGIPGIIRLPAGMGISSFATVLPGMATTQRVAMDVDPEGRRKVSTVEVPSPLEDPLGFIEAEARRIAQNVAAGRTIGDEFRDTPELAAYYEKVWGDPDVAYWVGTVGEVMIPAGPGAAAKGAGYLAKKVPLEPLARAGDEAAKATKAMRAKLDADLPKPELRSAYQDMQVKTLALIDAGGQAFADLGAVVVPGARSDARVAQRVADVVVKASELTADQKTAVAARLAGGVGQTGPEAADAVAAAVKAVAPDQQELAAQMHRQMLLNVPDDFVMVTETRAAPRAVAGDVRAQLERGTAWSIAQLGDDFKALPLAKKRQVVASIQDRLADTFIPGQTRRTRDLSALQVFTDDMSKKASELLRYKPFATPLARKAAVMAPKFRLESMDAASAGLQRKLFQAGQTAGRRVAGELAALSKTEGSTAKALDRMMRDAVGGDAGNAKTAWDKVLDSIIRMPGLDREGLVKFIATTPIDLTKAPTVAAAQALERLLINARQFKIAGSGRALPGADVEKAMLRALTEELLKKSIGREVPGAEAVRHGLGAALSAKAGTVEELLTDLAAQGRLKAMAQEGPVPVLSETGWRIPNAMPSSDVERKLAENAHELVTLLGSVKPRERAGLVDMAKDAMGYLMGDGRLNAIQHAKYGYGIPNIPFLVYKGLETPFMMAAQVGATQVAQSLPRASRRLFEQMTRRHLTGGGLTTAEGIYYSPTELLKLGELEGLGITAMEAERLGSLADDILAAARRADPKIRPWSQMSPFQKGFWQRSAEAMERSYRQGLFEARLLAGDTPTEAAQVTRRAAMDYSEVPEVVNKYLGAVFQGAGTAYKLATSVVLAAAKNPQAVTVALKTMRENKRRQDPADLAGDASLINIMVGDGDRSAYVPIPGARWMLGLLEAARHTNNLVVNLSEAYQAASESGESMPEVWWQEAGDDLGLLAYSLADPAIGGVLDALGEFETVSTMLPEKQQQQAQVDSTFWATMLWAHNADPQHAGAPWRRWETTFKPQIVPPPSGREVKGWPGYWSSAPTKGQPHVFTGRTADRRPLYQVLEPSPAAARNVAALQAMTPEQIERAIPIAGALLQGTESAFSEQAAPYKQIFTGLEVKGAADAAILQWLNPTGIDFSDPEGVRKAQAERVVEIRAPSE